MQNQPRKGMKSRWSLGYKRSINCEHPKGFSQKNYCKRQKRGGDYKESFKAWLENQENQIIITGMDRTGQISFLINGKKYIYSVDALIFRNKKFLNDVKYRPGTVLNWAKKNGTLVYP